jgi:hypothetical protein
VCLKFHPAMLPFCCRVHAHFPPNILCEGGDDGVRVECGDGEMEADAAAPASAAASVIASAASATAAAARREMRVTTTGRVTQQQ